MNGALRSILPGDHVPLTARFEQIEDPIENTAKWQRARSSRTSPFKRVKQRFHCSPKLIRDFLVHTAHSMELREMLSMISQPNHRYSLNPWGANYKLQAINVPDVLFAQCSCLGRQKIAALSRETYNHDAIWSACLLQMGGCFRNKLNGPKSSIYKQVVDFKRIFVYGCHCPKRAAPILEGLSIAHPAPRYEGPDLDLTSPLLC